MAPYRYLCRALTLFLLTVCWPGVVYAEKATKTGAAAPQLLDYSVEPILRGTTRLFRVDLRWRAGAGSKTKLVLPGEWAGVSFQKNIVNLTLLSPGATLMPGEVWRERVIDHRPRQFLHVRYEIIQDPQGEPNDGERRASYRPIVQSDYFAWIGYGAWAFPDHDTTRPVSIRLHWKKMPGSWTIANSFGAGARMQIVRASIDSLSQGIFVGGDYRLRRLAVNGAPIFVALRGGFAFSDEEFLDLAERVFRAERDFWPDHEFPYFLIVGTPLKNTPGNQSLTGTGLTNAFALYFSENAPLDRFKHLLAHELFHTWNPPKLGGVKEPEALLYWFSEGFTDYYTYLILLRAGLISRAEYLKEYNRVLAEYMLSPLREVDNERVRMDFFRDPTVEKLPYQRGLLLATRWNALILAKSQGRHSLDDVMRDMFRATRAPTNKVIDADHIDGFVRSYAGEGVLDDVRRYVDRGDVLPAAELPPDVCADLTSVERERWEPGFDLSAIFVEGEKRVRNVDPEGAAYRAGLRDGQRVAGYSVAYGDTERPIKLVILEGDAEKAISYFARGASVTIPQYRLRDSGAGPSCRKYN